MKDTPDVEELWTNWLSVIENIPKTNTKPDDGGNTLIQHFPSSV